MIPAMLSESSSDLRRTIRRSRADAPCQKYINSIWLPWSKWDEILWLIRYSGLTTLSEDIAVPLEFAKEAFGSLVKLRIGRLARGA